MNALSVALAGPTTSPVPEPVTAAHVPSPLQYVDDDALVPEFRLATGRLPVAWATGMLVQFVSAPLTGVPNAGAIRACPLGNTTVPVKVGDTKSALRSSESAVTRRDTVAPEPNASPVVPSCARTTVKVKLDLAVTWTISTLAPSSNVRLAVTPAPTVGNPVTLVSIIEVATSVIAPFNVVSKLLECIRVILISSLYYSVGLG